MLVTNDAAALRRCASDHLCLQSVVLFFEQLALAPKSFRCRLCFYALPFRVFKLHLKAHVVSQHVRVQCASRTYWDYYAGRSKCNQTCNPETRSLAPLSSAAAACSCCRSLSSDCICARRTRSSSAWSCAARDSASETACQNAPSQLSIRLVVAAWLLPGSRTCCSLVALSRSCVVVVTYRFRTYQHSVN